MAALTGAAVQEAIIRMGLDPSNYLKAVAAVDQANVKLVTSTEGVVVSNEHVTATNRTSADGFAKLEARYDPLIRAEQRRAAAIAQANRFLEDGTITQERHAAQLARVNAFYDQQAGVIGKAANSNINFNNTVGLGSTGVQRLGNIVQRAGFQTSLFVSDITSGQTSMRAFFNQGSQLLTMFGPWGAAFGAAVAVVGALAASLLTLRKETKEYGEEVDLVAKAEKDAKTATELYTTAVDRANGILQTSVERSEALEAARLAEARATATASINIELDNIARLKNIEILRQQTFAATQQARAARVSGALPEGAGVPQVPTADIEKGLDESFRRIRELQDLLGRLNDPAQLGKTRDEAAKAAEKAAKDAAEATQAETSALGELMTTMRQEVELLRATEQQRALYEATLKATAAAQQDYDKLLRDSPLLTGEELAAIEAVIAARAKEAEALDAIQRQQQEMEKAAADAARAQQDAADKTAAAWQEAGDIIGKVIGGALEDLIQGDFKWKDFLAQLAGAWAEMWISNAISSLGGSMGGVPIGSFAEGGSFDAGQPMIVGESGPEFMVPSRGGMVIPNDALGGTTINIYAPGADKAALKHLERIMYQLCGPGVTEKRSRAEILDQRRRGGSFGRQFA